MSQPSLQFGITQFPTPVFNTPHIAACFGGEDGCTIPLDAQGLLRAIETVLFPNSALKLLEKMVEPFIWRIKTSEYKYEGNYYIDERFIHFSTQPPQERIKKLPSVPESLLKLDQLVGSRYIWGGNWPEGIDLLTQLYPYKKSVDPLLEDTWQLKGVDCTGLIHYVSDGITERNTSKLIRFGKPIFIEDLSIEKIIDKVKELDLIAWEGHVVCVFDSKTSIESRLLDGVIKLNLYDRLSHIMQERKPVNDWDASSGPRFVVRRWHPANL